MRVAVETLEFVYLLEEVNRRKITLVSSFMLEEENQRNPFSHRKVRIEDLLELSSDYVSYSKEVEKRAKEIEQLGIMGMDAFHIACAETAKSDFFVTCDDLLVRRDKKHAKKLAVRIIGLMEFVAKEVLGL